MKMKSKHKWLTLLMTFVMLIGTLPITAFAEGHTHTEDCYAQAGALLCTIPESEEHTHSEECFYSGGELICGMDESEDVFTQGDETISADDGEGQTVKEEYYEKDGISASLGVPFVRTYSLETFENSLHYKYVQDGSTYLDTTTNHLNQDIFDSIDRPEAIFEDQNGDGDDDSLSIIGDEAYFSQFKVEADFQIADSYEIGQLKLVLSQPFTDYDYNFCDAYGGPLEAGLGYFSFDIGPGTEYWDMEVTKEFITLTNNVPISAGSVGHIQLTINPYYSYPITNESFQSNLTCKMIGNTEIASDTSLSLSFEGFPFGFEKPGTGNWDNSIKAKQYTEERELTEEEREDASNYYWVNYEVRANMDYAGSILPKELYYCLELPKGAILVDDSNFWRINEAVSTDQKDVYTCDVTPENIYDYHMKSGANFEREILVKYPIHDFNNVDTYSIKFSVWGNHRFNNDNVEYYYTKAAEIYRGSSEKVEDGTGHYLLYEDELCTTLNDFGFQYGGGYTGALIPDNENPYSYNKDISLYKGDMATDEGCDITVYPGGEWHNTSGITAHVVVGEDMLLYQTSVNGYVLAEPEEYCFSNVEIDPNSIYLRYGMSNSTELLKDDHTLDYEILIHKASDPEGTYVSYRSGSIVRKAGYSDNSLVESIDLPDDVNSVKVAFLDVPSGLYLDIGTGIVLHGRLKPTEEHYSQIVPTEAQDVLTKGSVAFVSDIEVWNAESGERLHTENETNYTGSLAGLMREIDLQTPSIYSLKNNSLTVEQTGHYRRRDTSNIPVVGVPALPIIEKDFSYSDMMATENNGIKGYENLVNLSVVWAEKSPSSISTFTVYDLMPEYLKDVSKSNFMINVTGGKELKLEDGTVLSIAEAEAYIKAHCTWVEDEDFNQSGRTMMTYYFDFSDNPLIVSEKNKSTGGYLPFAIQYRTFITKEDVLNHNIYLLSNIAFLKLERSSDDNFSTQEYEQSGNVWTKEYALRSDPLTLEIKKLLEADGSSNTLFSYATDRSYVTGEVTASLQYIRKLVKTDLTPDFSKTALATPGSEYVYRLKINTSITQKLKDIVIYDTLEAEDGSQWKGGFVDIDTSYMESLGAKPVCYYAVTDPGTSKISDTAVWSTNIPEDRNAIKAIAVDLTKTADGGDFLLDKDLIGYIDIKMKAPESEPYGNQTRNSYSVSMKSVDEDLNEYDASTVSDTTSVVLSETGFDLVFQKNAADTGVGLGGAQFNLKGTSNSGQVINTTAISSALGVVKFSHVPSGRYDIVEVAAPDGYKKIKEPITVEIFDDGSKIFQYNGSESNTLTVEDEVQVYGTLMVEKTVEGDGDRKKAFVFEVQLWDEDDKPSDGVYPYIKSGEENGTIQSGESFTLSDGQNIVISNLPVGCKYTVEEVDANKNGYMTTSAGASGSITKDQVSTAAFTNTYNGSDTPTPPSPEGGTGSLTVSKVVAGNAGSQTVDFHFTVTLSDDSVNGTYGDMVFANGIAKFTLRHSEQKTASSLPTGVQYVVVESDANQDGYTTTSTGASGSIIKDQSATAAFTNTKNSGGGHGGGGGSHDDNYGNLTVSKTVTGNAGDVNQKFTFTITLDRNISGQYGDMSFDKGVTVIKLGHAESSTAKGLPSGIHYSVTESDNEGYAVSAVGDTGTISDGKTAVAAFTNNKDAVPVKPDDPTTPDQPDNPNVPDEPSTPTTSDNQPTERPIDAVPQTGDKSNVGLWFTLMIISFAAFISVCIYGRKRLYTGHHVRK